MPAAKPESVLTSAGNSSEYMDAQEFACFVQADARLISALAQLIGRVE